MMSSVHTDTARTGRGSRARRPTVAAARRRVLGVGFLGWTFLAHGALDADTIVRLSGAPVESVKIIQANWDLVQYQVGGRGRAVSLSADQIASIDREAENPVLTRARAAVERGEDAEAIQLLKSAMGGGSKDWEKAEAAYRVGEAHLGAGDAKEAEAQLKAYLKDHEKQKDWHVPHALYALGSAQIAMKQYESAEASFKKLEDMPGQWKLRAQVGRARAVEAAADTGKFLEARQLLLTVARGRETPVDLRDEAYVVRGWIFVRQKQYDEAIKELKSVFFDPSKSREYRYDARRAEATYLLGRAYLELGGKQNLEQAELWLLRVPALYPNRGRIYGLSCRALAFVYKGLGNNTRAAEWLSRARTDGDGGLE